MAVKAFQALSACASFPLLTARLARIALAYPVSHDSRYTSSPILPVC